MRNKGFWRGWPITYDAAGEEWIFDDNAEPVQCGYNKRPCRACGRVFHGSNHGEPDPCFGTLPGVDNACCGHGVAEESYIRFTNGVVIKGFNKIEIPSYVQGIHNGKESEGE